MLPESAQTHSSYFSDFFLTFFLLPSTLLDISLPSPFSVNVQLCGFLNSEGSADRVVGFLYPKTIKQAGLGKSVCNVGEATAVWMNVCFSAPVTSLGKTSFVLILGRYGLSLGLQRLVNSPGSPPKQHHWLIYMLSASAWSNEKCVPASRHAQQNIRTIGLLLSGKPNSIPAHPIKCPVSLTQHPSKYA